MLSEEYANGGISYDKIYDFIEGWVACANQADTYTFRRKVLDRFEAEYGHEISSKEINRLIKTVQ